MLRSLRIENFALIDQLELNLSSGLTVLTGETGAGKSILLDAIDTVLGGRVGGRAVRHGCPRALLEAGFSLTPALNSWLETQRLEPLEEELLVSREILAGSSGSRSRSRINGVVVNRSQLEDLRRLLVEITAQGQTVQLGQSSQQRQWLDSYGGPELQQQRQVVAADHAAWQEARQRLEQRRQSESQRLQQQDLYRYQLEELGQAALEEADEAERLEQERERLDHVVELQQQSWQGYQLLYQNENDGPAAADLLGQADQVLSQMAAVDSSLDPLLGLVREAQALAEEAGRRLHTYGTQLESDPQRLEEVEERLRLLKQICRKYGPELGDAIAYRERIAAELAELEGGEQSVEALEAALDAARAHLDRSAAVLTQLRRAAADRLEEQLIGELKPLAMEKVRFRVDLSPSEPGPQGSDRVQFLFSPNPGEPLQPLSDTASGGEMSRFLLALKACFIEADPVETLIFDEIDAGVSGRVSQAIAAKLHQLGRQRQVLCVTHQPLIAALADQHYEVQKRSDLNHTQVQVEELTTPERRQQALAELTGGHSAAEAMTFVSALMEQARNLRQAPADPVSPRRRGRARA